jgi:hypothetical protein
MRRFRVLLACTLVATAVITAHAADEAKAACIVLPSASWVSCHVQVPRWPAPTKGLGRPPVLVQESSLYCVAIAMASLQHALLLS